MVLFVFNGGCCDRGNKLGPRSKRGAAPFFDSFLVMTFNISKKYSTSFGANPITNERFIANFEPIPISVACNIFFCGS